MKEKVHRQQELTRGS